MHLLPRFTACTRLICFKLFIPMHAAAEPESAGFKWNRARHRCSLMLMPTEPQCGRPLTVPSTGWFRWLQHVRVPARFPLRVIYCNSQHPAATSRPPVEFSRGVNSASDATVRNRMLCYRVLLLLTEFRSAVRVSFGGSRPSRRRRMPCVRSGDLGAVLPFTRGKKGECYLHRSV